MAHSSASALVVDEGRQVLLRVGGKFFELSQETLRTVLGLPAGPPGLGITIDRDRFRFEFPGDQQAVDITAGGLKRRLTKQLTAK